MFCSLLYIKIFALGFILINFHPEKILLNVKRLVANLTKKSSESFQFAGNHCTDNVSAKLTSLIKNLAYVYSQCCNVIKRGEATSLFR